MKRVHRALVTATTALAVIAAPAAAPAATAAAPEHADRAGLQRRLDDVVAAGAVGALAEVRDEHGVWRGTSGVAELGTTRAVPVDGRFRAGSITKTFVATVVLQLVGEGRLRLDDTVEAWLPGVVPDGHRHHRAPAAQPHQRVVRLPAHAADAAGTGVPGQPVADLDRGRAGPARGGQPADVRTAGFGLRVLEHQLPPARPDHREGDRPVVRPRRSSAGSSDRCGCTAPRCRGRRRGFPGRIRTATCRPAGRRDAPPRLHGDEPVGDGRGRRDDLHDARISTGSSPRCSVGACCPVTCSTR